MSALQGFLLWGSEMRGGGNLSGLIVGISGDVPVALAASLSCLLWPSHLCADFLFMQAMVFVLSGWPC